MPSSNCLLISLRRKTCNGVAENTSLGLKAPSLCDVQRNYEAMKEENLSGFALLVPLMLQFINGSECFTHNKRQSSRVLNVHLQYDFNQDNDSRGSCQRSSFSDARLLRFHNVTFRQKHIRIVFPKPFEFQMCTDLDKVNMKRIHNSFEFKFSLFQTISFLYSLLS